MTINCKHAFGFGLLHCSVAVCDQAEGLSQAALLHSSDALQLAAPGFSQAASMMSALAVLLRAWRSSSHTSLYFLIFAMCETK